MSKNQLILIVAVVVLLLGFVGIASYKSGGRGVSYKLPDGYKMETIRTDDHVIGNKEAKVVFVEYSDYECPVCAYHVKTLENLAKNYGTSTAFVFRHFPLEQIHPNAEAAARAAEAADKQGMFWQYSELLYASQNQWTSLTDPADTFAKYAEQMGMHKETFLADYASDSVKEKVASAFNEAMALGLDHTPAFFVNGKEITSEGLGSFPEFIARLEQGIAEALVKNK